LCLAQVLCLVRVASVVSQDPCIQLPVWPLVFMVMALFPTSLLPSALPLSVSAVALALVFLGFSQAARPECAVATAPEAALQQAEPTPLSK